MRVRSLSLTFFANYIFQTKDKDNDHVQTFAGGPFMQFDELLTIPKFDGKEPPEPNILSALKATYRVLVQVKDAIDECMRKSSCKIEDFEFGYAADPTNQKVFKEAVTNYEKR